MWFSVWTTGNAAPRRRLRGDDSTRAPRSPPATSHRPGHVHGGAVQWPLHTAPAAADTVRALPAPVRCLTRSGLASWQWCRRRRGRRNDSPCQEHGGGRPGTDPLTENGGAVPWARRRKPPTPTTRNPARRVPLGNTALYVTSVSVANSSLVSVESRVRLVGPLCSSRPSSREQHRMAKAR